MVHETLLDLCQRSAISSIRFVSKAIKFIFLSCTAAQCDRGWFGNNCQYQCHCAGSAECDNGGHCSSGCAENWFGPACQYGEGKRKSKLSLHIFQHSFFAYICRSTCCCCCFLIFLLFVFRLTILKVCILQAIIFFFNQHQQWILQTLLHVTTRLSC